MIILNDGSTSAVTENGEYLVTVIEDKAQIYSLAHHSMLKEIVLPVPINALVASPSNGAAVIVYNGREVQELSLPDLDLLRSGKDLDVDNNLNFLPSSVHRILDSATLEVRAVVGADLIKGFLTAQLRSGKKNKFGRFAHRMSEKGCLEALFSISRDATSVALVNASHKIVTFDLESGEKRSLGHISHREVVVKVAAHPTDGANTVALACQSGKILLARSTMEQRGEFFFSDLHWHSLEPSALTWDLDGAHIISGGRENVLIKWDASTFRPAFILPRLGSAPQRIQSNNTGHFVVMNGGHSLFRLTLDLSTLEAKISLARLWPERNDILAWHAPTDTLAKMTEGMLRFYNPVEQRMTLELDTRETNIVKGDRNMTDEVIDDTFAMSSDGKLLATGTERQLKIWRWKRETGRFEIDTRIYEVHCEGKLVNLKVDTLPEVNTDVMITSGEDAKVKLWTKKLNATWELSRVFSYKNFSPKSVAISRDMSTLAIIYENRLVTLWDSVTNRLLGTIPLGDVVGPIDNLCFGERRLTPYLMACFGDELRIWKLTNLTQVNALNLHGKIPVSNRKGAYITRDLDLYEMKDSLHTLQKVSLGERKSAERAVMRQMSLPKNVVPKGVKEMCINYFQESGGVLDVAYPMANDVLRTIKLHL